MIIRENSTIQIKVNGDLLEELISQEDIKIKGNGQGYTFILRNTTSNENSIIESESIVKEGEKFIVNGYWKDAILCITDNEELHKSYMEYDS